MYLNIIWRRAVGSNVVLHQMSLFICRLLFTMRVSSRRNDKAFFIGPESMMLHFRPERDVFIEWSSSLSQSLSKLNAWDTIFFPSWKQIHSYLSAKAKCIDFFMTKTPFQSHRWIHITLLHLDGIPGDWIDITGSPHGATFLTWDSFELSFTVIQCSVTCEKYQFIYLFIL